MATRAIIRILEGKKELTRIYKHWDGYPRGLGLNICKILGDNPSVVNGYSGDMNCPDFFNGAGCLAAYMVSRLKVNHIGNIYIFRAAENILWVHYTYTIRVLKGTVSIKVGKGKYMSVAKFKEFCNNHKE